MEVCVWEGYSPLFESRLGCFPVGYFQWPEQEMSVEERAEPLENNLSLSLSISPTLFSLILRIFNWDLLAQSFALSLQHFQHSSKNHVMSVKHESSYSDCKYTNCWLFHWPHYKTSQPTGSFLSAVSAFVMKFDFIFGIHVQAQLIFWFQAFMLKTLDQ